MAVRIRTAMLVALFAVSLLPMVAMLFSTYHQTVKRELQESETLQLMLARNLTEIMTRYEELVRASVNAVASDLASGTPVEDQQSVLGALGIEKVSIVDVNSREVVASTGKISDVQGERYTSAQLMRLERALIGRRWAFTPVQHQSSGPVIEFVQRSSNQLIVAHISPRYFNDIADEVTFGTRGHAAIVDQAGHVLAHPDANWVRSARDLSDVEAVRQIENGGSGIVHFHSPAVDADMLGAIATVPKTGWGVMVSKPIDEVSSSIWTNLTPILFWLMIALAIAATLVIVFLQWLARPLEMLSHVLLRQSRIGRPAPVAPNRARNMVVELRNIVHAYNDLAMTVERNADEMSERALRDTVTGIGNRAYFTSGAQQQIASRVPLNKKGVLLFMDLDNFKEVNDVRGHDVGDMFLKQFAQCLYPTTKRFMDRKFRGITAAYPIIGRIGGDEFAILLPLPDDVNDVAGICEELRQSLPKTLKVNDLQLLCQTSAGGAVYPDHGTRFEDLMRRADVALYCAKTKGKHRFELYSQRNVLGGRSEILSAVAHAIENDELLLEYQPKYCLLTQRVTGVEALLRWNHPDHGMIPPNLFLGAIQKTSVMNRVGEWVVGRSIVDMRALDAMGHSLKVAVNIGTEHFTSAEFVTNLTEQLHAADFDPGRLQIEITEDVMALSKDTYRQRVDAVQALGCSVAIDDFGRGFSNLARLASVSVDFVKLDRSMIWDAIGNERIAVITKSAIDMAHALGAKVVVEGVETLDQLKLAAQCGADAVQGFYFSKSLPPEQLSAWIKQREDVPPHSQQKQIAARLVG